MSRLPDWIKSGVMSGIFVFVTGVSATLIGWLNNVADWANGAGSVPFPDPSVLRGAVVSAAAGAAVAIVTALVRGVQERFGLGLTPDYTPADGNLGPPTP